MPLAQVEVTVEQLEELVDAVGRFSWPDAVSALASVSAALFAFALLVVTRRYTNLTLGIRDANTRMAEANDLMAQATNRTMLANEQMLTEMAADRETMLNEPSRQAAARLHEALALLAYRSFSDDEDAVQSELSDLARAWSQASRVDGHAIRDDVLRKDLNRFTWLLQTAASDRDVMRDDAAKSGYRLAPPSFRLNYLVQRLTEQLGAHRRGEPAKGPILPAEAHSWSFWSMPPGASAVTYQIMGRMADEAYDPARDLASLTMPIARKSDQARAEDGEAGEG